MPPESCLAEEWVKRFRSDWSFRTPIIMGPLLPTAPQRAGWPVGRVGRLYQRGNRDHRPFHLHPHSIGGYLGCGLGLLVQCPSSMPLAQGGPGLGAEPLGCTASVRLVVSNVVESPKPRGQIIPSWGRENKIVMALLGFSECPSLILRHR